jgi:hypothetical protein
MRQRHLFVRKFIHEVRTLAWVILCTVVVCILANFTLIYSFLFVHKGTGIVSLWGYAPQQFLFAVLFFPIAAFSTFVALYVLVTKLAPTLPMTFFARGLLDNWIATLCAGLALVSLVTLIVYFTSGMSFDKLRPEYAQRALTAAKSIDDRVASVKKDEREDFRSQMISKARKERETLQIPAVDDRGVLDSWLNHLEPEVYLQVIESPGYQLRLKLLHPKLHALSMLQILTVLFVALCAVISIAFCIVAAKELNYNGTNAPFLHSAISAAFYALLFFAAYSICYGQYRTQTESLVGGGTTILQDIFTGFLIMVFLVWLRTLDPSNRDLSFASLLNYLPVALVGTGTIVELVNPQLTRQLIGSDTTLGIQLILIFIVLLFSVIPIAQVWPRA